MSTDWRERLKRVIKDDGRSLRALSAEAAVGENYLQQMLKDEKDPGFTRLAKILSVLGPEATVYVTSGAALDPEMHLRVALVAYGVTDEGDLTTALNVVRKLTAPKTDDTPGPSLSRGQPQPASPRREEEPSERQPRRSGALSSSRGR